MRKTKDLFGAGPLSIIIIILLAVVVLGIENTLGFEKIVLNVYSVSLIVFMFFIGLVVAAYSFVSLPLSKRGKHLIMHGPYKHVRHPIYSALTFLFYPAISLILNSWPMLISTILVYVVFKIAVRSEEEHLIGIFGDEYREYMEKVPQFIPKLF